MTNFAIAHSNVLDSREAGHGLGLQITEAMDAPPDVVILFASPVYRHGELLQALKQACHPGILVGCSSAGEFTSHVQGEGLACAIAIRSKEIYFSAGIGRGLSHDRAQAAKEVTASFRRAGTYDYNFRVALILADALAGYTDDLVEHLTSLTHGTHQFFGGGAGDNALFHHTPVFYDTEVVSDAVVALEMLSNKPIGIGVQHGWQPVSDGMLVTEAHGMRLVSLDGKPALEAFQAHAQVTHQSFDPANPLPFFLHNLIGIDISGVYKLRVPLAVDADGSILCATDIPSQHIVKFMSTAGHSSRDAAIAATKTAMQNIYGSKPGAAIFFDCVASRLRMGREFGFELQAVQQTLEDAVYVGCNSHGQIARAEGQFSGFHNCTAVVCVIAE